MSLVIHLIYFFFSVFIASPYSFGQAYYLLCWHETLLLFYLFAVFLRGMLMWVFFNAIRLDFLCFDHNTWRKIGNPKSLFLFCRLVIYGSLDSYLLQLYAVGRCCSTDRLSFHRQALYEVTKPVEIWACSCSRCILIKAAHSSIASIEASYDTTTISRL